MSPLAGTDISTAIPLDTPSPKSVADAEQITSAMKGELWACICLTLDLLIVAARPWLSAASALLVSYCSESNPSRIDMAKSGHQWSGKSGFMEY
jgi:hypothetical protein